MAPWDNREGVNWVGESYDGGNREQVGKASWSKQGVQVSSAELEGIFFSLALNAVITSYSSWV